MEPQTQNPIPQTPPTQEPAPIVPPVPIIPDNPTPPPQPKSKVLYLVLTMFLVLIFFGIASFWIYQKFSTTSQPTPQTTVPTPTAIADPTADWETYTNNKYGYSLKYPDSFLHLICPNEELILDDRDNATKPGQIDMQSCARDTSYTLETKTYDSLQPEPKESKYYTIETKNITLGGLPGKLYIHTFTKIEDGPYPNWFAIARVDKDGKTYEIRFGTKDSLQLFSQILSTFKFTDNTTDTTANWKTYTEKSIGLAFKYPGNWSVEKLPGTRLSISITPDRTNERGFVPIQIDIDFAQDTRGNYLHFNTIQEAKTHYLKSLKTTIPDKDFLVDGKSATTISGVAIGSGPGEGYFLQYTFIQLDNKVLVVQLGKEEILEEYNQILSTFKFSL